jgi:hypothetical protein
VSSYNSTIWQKSLHTPQRIGEPEEEAIEGDIELIPKPIFLCMLIPDVLVIVAFLLLGWQLHEFIHHSHI